MIILITGKSGSGKTFIANKLADFFDAKVLSLDEISHNVLNDCDVKDKIKSYFGDAVFYNNSTLNRKKLGEIVFNDKQKLEYLNNLTQTKMENIIDDIINNNEDKNFILEYALLPKMKYFNLKNCKILIKSNIYVSSKLT